MMCNAAFLTEYYKIYPQGDDRDHAYLNAPKIGLDIDEVLADWVGHWTKHHGQEVPETWNFDRDIKSKFELLKDDKEFWLSIPVKTKPSDIHFEPHCYITSRSIPKEWTEEWLDKNGAINPETHPKFYKDGKIVSGLGEKVKSDPSLVKVYRDVVTKLPEEKKKEYAESNYKDNQWYFRSIGAKTVEFTNEDEYKKYLEENKDNRVGEKSPYFKTGKEGAYVRPVLLKEQEFDSKEKAQEFAKDKDPLYGDFYGSDDPNVFIRPKFKGQPEEVKPPTTAPNEPGKIEDLGKQPAYRYPRMFYTPDQRTLPPTAMLPHLKIDTKLGRIDPIRMGIEQQLQNISDSRVFAADRLDDLPPSQRAAAMASITASSQMAENQATFQTNQWNAQNWAQTQLYNMAQRDREAMANAQNALDYERRAYIARDVFDKNLRGFFDYNRRVALSDYDYNRKMNLASSIFPDYSPNFYGNMIEFDPDSEVTLEDRRALIGTYGNMSV
jgi:hypothetical protein